MVHGEGLKISVGMCPLTLHVYKYIVKGNPSIFFVKTEISHAWERAWEQTHPSAH